MNRFIGLLLERHSGFDGSSTAFFHITLRTGRDQILPTVFTPSTSWHHVIEGQVRLMTAILTGVLISFHHIASGEDNAMIGQVNVALKANHRGIVHFSRGRLDHSIGVIVKQFSLLQEQQFNRPLDGTDREGLIILIEK